MEFGGKYHFAAPRDAVWAALNDTAILAEAIPGCKSIVWITECTLDLKVKLNLGVMQPTLSGELELSAITPAVRYTLSGRGRGRLLGMAHAAADIELSDAPGGTMLVFAAQGKADGTVMKLGRALIGEQAQGVIDGFFARIGVAMGTTVTPT